MNKLDHSPQPDSTSQPEFLRPPAASAGENEIDWQSPFLDTNADFDLPARFRRAIDQALGGLSFFKLPEPLERIVKEIIRFGLLRGRDVAPFHSDLHLARLLNVDRTGASRNLALGRRLKIIHRFEYALLYPVNKWKAPQRAPDKRSAAQEDLLVWLNSLKVPPDSCAPRAQNPPSAVRHAHTDRPPRAPAAQNTPAYNHEKKHDSDIMPHDRSELLQKVFEVGALGKKTGAEILEELLKAAPDLERDHLSSWRRRIAEDARLVWQGVVELQQRHDVGSKAGWLNRFYLRERGIK